MKNILVLLILSPLIVHGLKHVYYYFKRGKKAKCSSCSINKSCSLKHK